MSCTLLFDGLMTSSWSAEPKSCGTKTDIRFTWGGDAASWLAEGISSSQIVLKLPFNTFAQYVTDCEQKNIVADLRDENLPKIAQRYSSPVPAAA